MMQASATQTVKAVQLIERGSLAAMTMAAALCLAASRKGSVGITLLGLLFVALLPVTLKASRRVMKIVRRWEAEENIIRNTQAYFNSAETAPPLTPLVPRRGRPRAGFLPLSARTFLKPAAGELVVFDAISASPRSGFSPAVPRPVTVTFGIPHPTPVVASEFECWKTERHPVTIEYAGAVLEEIRVAAVDGYQRMRHGGVEVGGVLFGEHRNGVLRILAARPVACEYAEGPRFVLSERDQIALADQLKTSRHDIELQGLEAVGCYLSHTRSEVSLSEQDIAYFNRFFPLPWQVALVVRPSNLMPARAGFFFREASGRIRTESSYCEFQLTAPATAAAAA